jgi:outer membrane receptor protein involved in Fe transport
MAAALLVLAGAAVLHAADAAIRGRITDPEGLPLPGVMVTLKIDSGSPRSVVTDNDGRYSIGVPPGLYALRAELSGFQPIERRVLAGGFGVVVDVTLPLASFEEQVTVVAAPLAVVGEPRPDAPVTVTREVLDAAMLPNSQYDDALTLMPGVVRGPDGLISVSGARASQGAVYVNGFNQTDPASGSPNLLVPLEAVDSVQVYSGGYSAGFGQATSGVTAVTTRSGGDTLHMSANSMFPRLLFASGGIRGVEYWEPNFGVSGPLVKGRLFAEQAVSYRYDQNRFLTQLGEQYSKYTALMSWSQIDAQVSPTQHLLAMLSLDPQDNQHANVTAFTPTGTVPRVQQGGWRVGLADRLTTSAGPLVELKASAVRTRLNVTPDGSDPYTVGHDVTSGSYFDRQDLHALRREAGAGLTTPVSVHHLVKAGLTLSDSEIEGVDESRPVSYLRSDRTLSRQVAFETAPSIFSSTVELGAFVQDDWTPTHWLTVNAGVRYDRVAAAAAATWSPRAAWTVKAPGGLSVSGSAGIFVDKLMLQALRFRSCLHASSRISIPLA